MVVKESSVVVLGQQYLVNVQLWAVRSVQYDRPHRIEGTLRMKRQQLYKHFAMVILASPTPDRCVWNG